MRRFPALLAALLLLVPATLLAADAAPAPQRFGAAVKLKKPVDIAQLASAPETFKGRTVRLEGTVKEVCQGMGCWVEVVDANGASFIARSLDEKILLPKDCKGAPIVVEGRVTTLPRAKMAEAKPEDHACPRPTYVVATRGVELGGAAPLIDAPLPTRAR